MNYRTADGRNLTRKEIKEKKRTEAEARNLKTDEKDRRLNRKK